MSHIERNIIMHYSVKFACTRKDVTIFIVIHPSNYCHMQCWSSYK